MPKFKSHDGVNLSFNTAGQGTPLVFIAGGFCDHHVWDDIIKFFNDDFLVINYDNRGIGESDLSHEYSVELLANDLFCLLKHLKISSAHIVGHSMGGFVAQYFAAHYSDMVLSLSLLSSLLSMNSLGKDYLCKIESSLKNNPCELHQFMMEVAGRAQSTNSILQQITLCKNHDARSYVNKIYAPTLIMSGLKEPVVTKAESLLLASAIPNAKQTVLLDCGHMLQRESPNEVAKEILTFLQV